MRKSLFIVVLAGVVALGVVSGASAGTQYPTLVNVPFSFVAGGQLMPAGSYRIAGSERDGTLILVSSTDGGNQSAYVATERIANPNPSNEKMRVMFRTYAGQRFLWRVIAPGSESLEVSLQDRQMDIVLARLNLLPPHWTSSSTK